MLGILNCYAADLKLNSSMMRKSGRYDLSYFALNNALRFGLDEDRAVIQVLFFIVESFGSRRV